MSSAGPGWRPDPVAPGQLRWWDGERWTEHEHSAGSGGIPPMPPFLPGEQKPPSWIKRHLVPLAALFLIGLLCTVSALSVALDSGERGDRSALTDERGERRSKKDRSGSETGGDSSDKPTGVDTATKGPEPEPPPTYFVVRVVDGDTVELGNGDTVRLAGIDAPEVGECGHERATAKLVNLVDGRQVTLGESDEDRDRYGRLLRYIDRGSTDAGLEMIESGLAIARYDSRDGYGRHPREQQYVKADRMSPDIECEPPQKQFVDAPSNCEPGYSPCVPTFPPDLDCADTGPVTVTGSDPHGLDGDGDGVACGGD